MGAGRRRTLDGHCLFYGVLFLFLSVFAAPTRAEEPMKPDYDPWRRLMDNYLTEGTGGAPNLVDYAALKADPAARAALKAYIAALEEIDPEGLTRDGRFAFWVNLYNAVTVDVVIDHYPVASIRDISISPGLFSKGPWGKKLVTMGGRELSLDDIEHAILRPQFKDERVHYAVNCASWSCPDLAPEPYEEATLDATLDAAAHAYINSPRGARFDDGELVLSSIFDWYQKDFGGGEAGVLAHIRKYADDALAAKLEGISHISSYDYDWSLNGTARPEDRK